MFKKLRGGSKLTRSSTGDPTLWRRITKRSSTPGLRHHTSFDGNNNKENNNIPSTASTIDSSQDENYACSPQTVRWVRTDSIRNHNKNTNNNNNNNNSIHNQAQQQRQNKMKQLPSTAAFSSNHILVNRERIHRGKEPLVRCRHLDGIAKKHAQEMAQAQELLAEPIRTAHMAENVQRGPSIRVIHQMIMIGVSDVERDNILSDRFRKFGMGTATGEDGMIYMSQIFQEAVSGGGNGTAAAASTNNMDIVLSKPLLPSRNPTF